jgi:Holliday junction resolvase RusA-like endonuclease
MRHEFFLPMIPPTVTAQEHAINVKASAKKGRPIFYDPSELKAARVKLQGHLGKHIPTTPAVGAVRFIAKWCFPITAGHSNGEYKTSKPDTDNLQKLLKDVMTVLGFWNDDAQVASEIVEKFWADTPGIYIAIENL